MGQIPMKNSLVASGRRQLLVLGLLALILLQTAPLRAELRRIEVRRRDDFGTYERIIGRAFFAVDPALAANGGIADVKFAPKNADGQVEFAGDLLYFRPRAPAKTRGTVFLEIVNRGRDQALGLMSAAVQQNLAPEKWDLGDRRSEVHTSERQSPCNRVCRLLLEKKKNKKYKTTITLQ